MKITVEVEVPENQDCHDCKFCWADIGGVDCLLFNVSLKWQEKTKLHLPCPACLRARKEANAKV